MTPRLGRQAFLCLEKKLMTESQIKLAAIKIAAMRVGKATVLNKKRNTRRIIENQKAEKMMRQLSVETT